MVESTVPSINGNICLILENLIKHRLKTHGFRNTYPDYINQCFAALVINQTQIVINLEQIHKYFAAISHVIIYSHDENANIENSKNIFKNYTYELYPNVKNIIFYADTYENEIDLMALLSLMHSSSVKYNKYNVKTTVNARWKSINERSWIYHSFIKNGIAIASKEIECELIVKLSSPMYYDGKRANSLTIEHIVQQSRMVETEANSPVFEIHIIKKKKREIEVYNAGNETRTKEAVRYDKYVRPAPSAKSNQKLNEMDKEEKTSERTEIILSDQLIKSNDENVSFENCLSQIYNHLISEGYTLQQAKLILVACKNNDFKDIYDIRADFNTTFEGCTLIDDDVFLSTWPHLKHRKMLFLKIQSALNYIQMDTELTTVTNQKDNLANISAYTFDDALVESLEKIDEVLRYYDDYNKGAADVDKLIKFCHQKIPECLNHFNYLLQQRNVDVLNGINYYCDIKTCKILKQYFRNRNKDSHHDQNNNLFSVYRDILDSMHFYVAHQFESGYRYNDQVEVQENDEQLFNYDTNWKEFRTNQLHIPGRNKYHNIFMKCGRIRRFSNSQNYPIQNSQSNDANRNEKEQQNSTNNRRDDKKNNGQQNERDNKHNRKNDGNDEKDNKDNDEDGNDEDRNHDTKYSDKTQKRLNICDTFLDELYQFITIKRMKSKKHLVKYIENEEYDSDAIFDDIGYGDYDINIATKIPPTDYSAIVYYIQCKKVPTFSIGYIFYYWEFYKYQKDSIFALEHDYYWNKNDYSGYKPYQLYVSQKYKNIKTEMLINKVHSININAFNVNFRKSNTLFNTHFARTIIAASDALLRYNIPENDPITTSHLLSVALYCNHDDLCTEFSTTFRMTNPLQQLSFVHKRNREFSNWSRLLRETVEIYGGCNYSIKGPFYCGMDRIMVMNEFNIRLCAPTSTSLEIEVADRFGGDNGIVIQMNNNGYANANKLRCFKCSWISCHPEENEVLYMGGFERIKVETIRSMCSNINYYPYIQAFFYLHCMLNGTIMDKKSVPTVSEDVYLILENLIKSTLKIHEFIRGKNNYPTYINYCFRAFRLHQTQIVINLEQIHKYFQQLSHLIIYSDSANRNALIELPTNISVNNKNLFSYYTYELYPNIEKIIIYAGNYEMDLISLLSLFHSLSQKHDKKNVRITVKAIWK
eukprot:201587_1